MNNQEIIQYNYEAAVQGIKVEWLSDDHTKCYPKPFDYELNLVDPEAAKKALDVGLEDSGLMVIKKSWSILTGADPKITFTDKAKPYLLGTPTGSKPEKARMVKIADEDITEIVDIQNIDDTHARVYYNTSYSNLTPFKPLVKRPLTEPEGHNAFLILGDDGWRVAPKDYNPIL